MAQNRKARIVARFATIAIALSAFAGIGTAFAPASQAAPTNDGPANTVVAQGAEQAQFSTRIANVGGQDQIDACTGGLTKMVSVSNYMGRNYFPIHNECGGAPILDLVEGNIVNIAGLGNFTVVATQDVMRGDTASLIANMAGEILLQTCHNSGEGMRVVGLIHA